MRANTARHSPFPRSHTHLPNRFPCGSPAVATLGAGGQLGLPRSRFCPPSNDLGVSGLRLSFPRWRSGDVCSDLRSATGHLPFWLEPSSTFGFSAVTMVIRQFIYVAHTEFPSLHAVLEPAAAAPCRQGHLPSKYIVSGASHPTVTGDAYPGRKLLAAQQVAVFPVFRMGEMRRDGNELRCPLLLKTPRGAVTRVALSRLL